MSSITRQISRLDNQVVRPQLLDYVNPSAELKRLEARGVVYQISRGNYVLIPERSRKKNNHWMPEIEAAALGLAIAAYGKKNVALIGPSAIRIQKLYPRALGIAYVAVPVQRPAIKTKLGTIRFIKRDVSELDLVPIKTELCSGYATSLEETLIDLLRTKPQWDLGRSTIKEMIESAYDFSDKKKVLSLARKHRGMSALINMKLYSKSISFNILERKAKPSVKKGLSQYLTLRYQNYVVPKNLDIQSRRLDNTQKIKLPLTLNWSNPDALYDMSSKMTRAILYEIVLREGTTQDVIKYVNFQDLKQLWSKMYLPQIIEEKWLEIYPELGKSYA